MSISRHNYETFFLLYIDNELSGTEKKAVDEFVQANPDLQEEFVMLQQSILKADDIVFDAREILFRKEPGTVNFQEKLLLHLDHELNTGEQKEIEEMISSDAGIQKEWLLFKQTKLEPDTNIVFEDKQSLYRKEGGRVVAFSWLRWAAAAVFIGFAIWGGITYLSNGNEKPGDNSITTKTNEQLIKKTIDDSDIKPTEAPDEAPVVEEENTNLASEVKETGKSRGTQTAPTEKVILKPKTIAPDQQLAVQQQSNNLPKPYSGNINNNSSNNTTTAIVTPEKPHNIIENPGTNEIDGELEKATGDANTFATIASLTENNEESNNNRVFFMNEEKIRKTKLGGIFKKVKRVFERNANIKPGNNNIKVANLEFAIQ